ncbi:MAG: hypothetical protein EPN62_06710 [Candidimonas sp.]|nr:MAG: hypothetical protein EPN77_10480 [Candidimonas sp.]TAM24468.1 MAG: hypothetical protein EPN62_06710 [Candidimonas sp.]
MFDRVTHRAARSCPGLGAASGAVDNPTLAKPHLTMTVVCPNKRGHLCLWGETIMFYLVNDIADFIEQNGSSIKSLDVQLVSLPQMNHTERWIMEPLVEIASGILPDTGSNVVVFKCLDGSAYVDHDIHECAPKLKEQKIIYRHRPTRKLFAASHQMM